MREGSGGRAKEGCRGDIPHGDQHTNLTLAAGRPEQLTYVCIQTLTQRLVLSCMYCSANTAHIITLCK